MADRRNTSATLGILAAITVVAIGAILAVTQLRSPDPDATPTTSPDTTTTTLGAPTTTATTTTVPSVTINPRGEQFQWDTALDIPRQRPLELLEHEETLYLFTTSGRPFTQDARSGLQVWASTGGSDWTQLGSIGERYHMSAVASTQFGLMAFGRDPDTREGLVWISQDGVSWESSVIDTHPTDATGDFTGAVVTADVVAAMGYRGADYGPVARRIEDALYRHLGEEEVEFRWDVSGNSLEVTVFASFWMPPQRLTGLDLGLTPDDYRLPNPSISNPRLAWVTSDGVTWREMPGDHWDRDQVFAGPDGRIWLNSWGQPPLDEGMLATADGSTWERVGDRVDGYSIAGTPWGFMGTSFDISERGVTMSDDAQTWTTFGPSSMLGPSPRWAARSWAGGTGGVAIVAVPIITSSGSGATEHAEWVDGDLRVRVTQFGSIEVYQNFGLVGRADLQSPDSNARYDTEEGSLTITGFSGDDLVTLDADALSDLEAQLGELGDPEVPTGPVIQGFLFSGASTWPTPGVFDPMQMPQEWTVQDLRTLTDDPIHHLLVAPDRVILVTSGEGGLSVIVGPIPDIP